MPPSASKANGKPPANVATSMGSTAPLRKYGTPNTAKRATLRAGLSGRPCASTTRIPSSRLPSDCPPPRPLSCGTNQASATTNPTQRPHGPIRTNMSKNISPSA